MPNVTPHKLTHLEIDPPREAWDRITTRLDQEFDPRELAMAQKLDDWEATPPTGAWTAIATALTVEEEVTAPPSNVISIPYRKLAIAAVLAGLISLVTWNILRSDVTIEATAAISSNTNAGNAAANNTATEPLVPPDVPPAVDDARSDAKAIIAATEKTNRNTRNTSTVFQGAMNEPELAHEANLTDLRTQDLSSPANVQVSPIRDARGNIVMDVNLIKLPGNNYITVTGPNGEQTRISSKFLPMLTSLNSAVEKSEYFENSPQQNSIWKKKFRDWRNILMQQVSFAPSATNFLDILELKEMLEEK